MLKILEIASKETPSDGKIMHRGAWVTVIEIIVGQDGRVFSWCSGSCAIPLSRLFGMLWHFARECLILFFSSRHHEI